MSDAAQVDEPVAVVGAGLAGSMFALFLARRGIPVNLYERGPDVRVSVLDTTGEEREFGNSTNAAKRSINLALSHRGQSALNKLRLLDEVMRFAIPMSRRVLHDKQGRINFQPYGTKLQAINSVSRADLNRVLLDAVERHDNVNVFFEHKLAEVTRENVLMFETPSGPVHTRARLVVGADGAYSSVRRSMLRQSRANFSRHYIPHGYKELTIPATATGEFALPHANGLHIWPRGNFMMIALPNPDHTFTCTLFAPFEGKNGFASLRTREDVTQFFTKNFPDAVPVMPDLLQEFFANPTGALVTVRMDPWNVADRMLVVGDAAHGVVPFYGQGMNCAFEDALMFDEVLEQCGGDLSQAVPRYAELRRPAADALADLSLENYKEMRHKTASMLFRARKRVEAALHWLLPNTWIPLYTMVAFTRIPYDEAVRRARRQDAIMDAATAAVAAGALGVAALVARRYLARRT